MREGLRIPSAMRKKTRRRISASEIKIEIEAPSYNNEIINENGAAGGQSPNMIIANIGAISPNDE